MIPRRARSGLVFFTSSIASLAFLASHACGDPSHVFEGRLYLEARDCLGTNASVDVVEGERSGECGPTCLAQPQADGGRAIYVATMCGPYPFLFDASGSDPACAPALAARTRNDTCLVDGGSSAAAPVDRAMDAGEGG